MRKRQLLSAFCLNRSFFFLFCPSNNYKKWLAFAPNFYLGFLQLRKSSLLSNLPSKELNGEKRSKSGANRDCDEITALFLGKKLTRSLSLTFSNTMTKTLCVTFIYRKTIKTLKKILPRCSGRAVPDAMMALNGSNDRPWHCLIMTSHFQLTIGNSHPSCLVSTPKRGGILQMSSKMQLTSFSRALETKYYDIVFAYI